ncbi:MAG TPA: class II fructose-bisphosphate aldolase [Candidatus Marinimicrobia bacterium]|nr:class II fructose-bisphosphate aldolase [Candidatus Neomarinimicrobiota bacterium]
MSIVNHAKYVAMLEKAHKERFAYPAINVTMTDTMNAAIEGFAAANSDGIIQVSTGGGAHATGNVKDSVLGAIILAEQAHYIAEKYDINIALHTDHCQTDKIDSFLKPLIAETARRRKAGLPNLYNSHMYDGSAVPLKENMEHAVELLKLCAENEIILEVEAGVVGGEEDGVNTEGVGKEKLYTTPEDMLEVYEALNQIKGAKYMFAATFGNVHGVYKPGNVVLKPTILRDGQDAVMKKYGKAARFFLVFHGGSGSSLEEIHETLKYGVIKMNIDTDTQYAFTRPVVHHMFTNYDKVLKVEGEVGVKKLYDPRAWLKAGRKGMADRVVQACNDLKSAGKSMGR